VWRGSCRCRLWAADSQTDVPFLRSKYEADRHLLGLRGLDACVAQPSLVFGPDGASSQRFLALAALPVLPLPMGGLQRVQPIHIDDAVEALLALVEAPAERVRGRRLPLVGSQVLPLRDYLLALRRGLGRPTRALLLRVPAPLMAALAYLGDLRSDALLNRASWTMLQRGSTADVLPLASLLGRLPRPVAEFIAPQERLAVDTQAQLTWLLPMLRLSLAAVWLATAAVSAGLYPLHASFELLGNAGVPKVWQPVALWGAVGLDLLLGVLTLWPVRSPRWLWLMQGGLMLFYSVVISLRLPEFWLHPYGPMTKNLPMLALLVLLWQLEPRRAPRAG
jgi:hypothetical protein